MLIIYLNDGYRSLPVFLISNDCINLALLKNNCAMYFISASAVSIIEIILKIFFSNADAKDRKFDVMMTSLPLTLK